MDLGLKLKEFHANAKDLMPYLRANTRFNEINTDQSFELTMDAVRKCVEPTVVVIRPGATAATAELRAEIAKNLAENHGYMNVDVKKLENDEMERKTNIGLEMTETIQNGKKIAPELTVKMLKKVVYNGNPACSNFVLTGFPEVTEEARAFEGECASIKALIYSTTKDNVVELKGNNLAQFNIDTLF
jgi:hypothetical protein